MLKAEPFNLSGTDFGTKQKIGALCAVYEQCQVVVDIAIKADEERIRQNLPPEISDEHYEQAIKLFVAQYGDLERHMTPSKGSSSDWPTKL